MAALRTEIGQEVVAEAAEKAKAAVAGLSFEGESENEHAKTAIDKATEAAHIAVKVATQFEEHAIEHAAEHAAHEAKRLRTLENLLADAGQEGAWPAYREGMLKSAAKMDVVSGLTYLEGALHGLAGILAITDPVKREEMLRKRPDLIGGIAAGAQIEKVVLQLAAGATAVVGATAYAFARRLLGKEALAAQVLSKGIKVLEKFEVVISAVMVVHGVLTLLDSEASAEEKEEAVLDNLRSGRRRRSAKFTGAFEGGPATLAVVISFFTLKALAEAAYSFSVDLVKISLNMSYHSMRRDALEVNDEGLRLALGVRDVRARVRPGAQGDVLGRDPDPPSHPHEGPRRGHPPCDRRGGGSGPGPRRPPAAPGDGSPRSRRGSSTRTSTFSKPPTSTFTRSPRRWPIHRRSSTRTSRTRGRSTADQPPPVEPTRRRTPSAW